MKTEFEKMQMKKIEQERKAKVKEDEDHYIEYCSKFMWDDPQVE